MNKLKINIWLNIVIISISILTIVTGVYSIFSAKLTITGSIGYVAPPPEVQAFCAISGATNGTSIGTTSNPLYATNNTTSTTKARVTMDDEGNVTFGNLNFVSSSDAITFNINITNDSSETIAVDIDFESLNLTGITRTVSTDYLQIIRPSSYTGTIADNDASIKSSESASIFTFTFTKISGSTSSISGKFKINIQPAEQISTSGYTFRRWSDSSKTCRIMGVPACDVTTNPTKTITIPSYFYDSDNDRYVKVSATVGDDQELENISSYTNVIVGNGISEILYLSFTHSDIKSIILPSSCKTIGRQAFGYCKYLESITIPSGVTNIDNIAFQSCSSFKSITIPPSVTSIGDMVFYGCSSLTDITIPSIVTKIGLNVFSNTPFLTNLKSDSDGIYTCSDGKKIMIEASSTDITSAPDLTGVYFIAGYAFYNCSGLTSINIPSSVTSIGSSAFYNCSGLTSINIPSSVTSIGSNAFSGCSKLTSVTFKVITGWNVGGTSLDGTISSTDLAANAKLLTSTYYSYTWTRSKFISISN